MIEVSLVPLGKCVEKVKAWNPKSQPNSPSFMYIDLSSIDKEKKTIDPNMVCSIQPSEAPSRAKQLVQTGDILVSTVRPNLNGVAEIS